ncbi:MAG: hypothetical protein AB7H93_23625 [Vicinamibacterales bacterium]
MLGDEFAGGEQFTPDNPMRGNAWVVEEIGAVLRVHPSHLVDPEHLALVAAWFTHAGGGGGMLGASPGPLPCAGGALDQPAWVMDAFSVIGCAVTALRKRSTDGRA